MKFILNLIAIFFISTVSFGQEKILNLIPYPLEVKQTSGFYILNDKITVSSNLPSQHWRPLFSYLKAEMKKQFGIDVSESVKGKKGVIDFFMTRMPTSGKPAYKLKVSKYGISIQSNFGESAFHAMQTLIQLLPIKSSVKYNVPFVEIFDNARFAYRGMHLDVGRHFFPVSFIKKYIDYLAYHKLNIFHWHLTEDQGWRIEIKKYPELTSIGSSRNGTILGRYPGTGNDNIPYGGFYTQKEIKEVVQYAKERFIEVIPEIEMPGHSSAAIAAYKWLSCFPEKPTEIPTNMISKESTLRQAQGQIKLVQETWGVFDDIFCAGKDSTFLFLQNVIDEVITLFPSKYFHIGGDEAPKTHWKKCTACQKKIKELKLKDEHELQSWFVQRIEKYLNSKGKTLIGWDEILEGGLAPNAVVMSWRGEAGGIEAAKQKHNVIMTPGNPVYFDHTQSENEDSVTIGGYNPIEKVYAYEPVPKELTEGEARKDDPVGLGKYVLGAQANVWTEYMGNEKKVEYMFFPRMAALSEVLWSKKENKNWENFERRLPEQLKRYEKWGANYSKAYFDMKTTVLPTQNFDGVLWKIESKVKQPIIINFNNYDSIWTYTKPQLINKKTTAYAYYSNETQKNSFTQQFHFNIATGKKITLTSDASKNYPGDGAFTLVNGIQNIKGRARSNEFLGFSGTNCDGTIDFGGYQGVSNVIVHTFQQKNSWIWAPASVEVLASVDGMYFTTLGSSSAFTEEQNGNGTINIKFNTAQTIFLRVIIKNNGTIPEGNPGSGKKAWLFVDEIEVH